MESNMKDKKQQAVPQSEAESFGIKRNPAVRAPRICLSEEEVIRIMRNEDAIKKKSKRLLNYILCIQFFSGMHSIVSASQFPYTNLSQGCH